MRIRVIYGRHEMPESLPSGYTYESTWTDLNIGDVVEVSTKYSTSEPATVIGFGSDYHKPVKSVLSVLERNPNPPRLYPITYKIMTDTPMTTGQIKTNPNMGGCDAVVLISIMFPKDGGRSESILSKDGRTGQDLDDSELFKCLIGLAHKLSLSETLGPGRKEFAAHVFELARQAILAGRKAEEDTHGSQ